MLYKHSYVVYAYLVCISVRELAVELTLAEYCYPVGTLMKVRICSLQPLGRVLVLVLWSSN